MVKKIISVLLILLIFGIMQVSAQQDISESASTPITIELNMPILAPLDEAAEAIITVSSVEDAPNTGIDLILPEGVFLVNGESSWVVNLTANIPVTLSSTIMVTETGNFEITAVANYAIDKENSWGDIDAIYLSVNPYSAAPYVESNTIAQAVPDDDPTIQGPEFISMEINNIEKPPSVEQALVDQANMGTLGTLTLTGTFSYWTNVGDFRDVSDTRVPANQFLVEMVDANSNHLSYAYTNSSGEFTISAPNPGTAVKLLVWTYVSYANTPTNDELMVISLGGSWLDSYKVVSPSFGPYSDGTHDVGGWQLIQHNNIEGAFWLKDDLTRAYKKTPSSRRSGPGTIEWSFTSTVGTYYHLGGNIHLMGVDRKSADTSVHEYAHAAMWNLYGGSWPTDDCPSPHYLNKLSGPGCAWSEGFADFFPLYVNGNPTYTWASGSALNLETPSWPTAYWDDGDQVEGRVAGALWDIYDSVNDGDDQITDGFGNIWSTVYDQNDNNFNQYWAALNPKYSPSTAAKAALYQNTIDYNVAPLTPNTPIPVHGATNQLTNPTLSWIGGDGDSDQVTYTVYLSTSTNPTTQRCAGTSTSCVVTGLSYSTTYYWKVVATDGMETATSSVWRFTTKTAPCTYTISPISNSFGVSGGSGNVSVSSSYSSCAWTATSNVNWISITSGNSGSGSGSVGYLVAANTGTSSRTGTATIAGKTFTVTQTGLIGIPPTITVSTDKTSYAAGDTVITTFNFKNPTATSMNTLFVWYLAATDYSYVSPPLMVRPIPLPAGFDQPFDVPIVMPNLGTTGLNLQWMVELRETSSPYNIISEDTTDWQYVPISSIANSEIDMEVVEKEMTKTVKNAKLLK